jgi:hypothetical protein
MMPPTNQVPPTIFAGRGRLHQIQRQKRKPEAGRRNPQAVAASLFQGFDDTTERFVQNVVLEIVVGFVIIELLHWDAKKK